MSTTGNADSPQQAPAQTADVWLPDGLVLSDRGIVTDTAILTGAEILPRGAVLGRMHDGRYRLAAAGAADGSNVPAAILAHRSDPTAGDVRAGIYLAGDFDGMLLTLDPSISLLTAQAALRPRLIFVTGLPITAANP